MLSPLPGNVERARRFGLPVRAADRQTVHDVLFRELPLSAEESLVVAWAGHGFLDLADHRRLLYADAREDDLRSLDLEAALAAFRSDLTLSYRDQVWFVDACQTRVDPAAVHGALVPDPVPHGRLRTRPGQHVLFGSAPGQATRNAAGLRRGTFSTELLRLLPDFCSAQAPWPPDTEALFAALTERLGAGAAPAGATPTYLHHSGPEGARGRWPGSGPNVDPDRTSFPSPDFRRAGTPSPAQVGRLLEALIAVPTMRTQEGRNAVLGILPSDIATSVARSPVARADILAIIETCREFEHGLDRLREALSLVDAGTAALREVVLVLSDFPGFDGVADPR
nr:hypothetical protein [Streptomyces sp. SID3343]